MYKRLIFLLIIALLLSGCAANNNSSDSIYFYYYSVPALYDQSSEIIYSKQINSDLNGLTLEEIISKYLQGPTNDGNSFPFPAKTTLVNLKVDTDALTVILSSECAKMQELEQTLAASCLARTLFQFCQAERIIVKAENGFEYTNEALIFTRTNILTDQDFAPVH